jgi:hypothetical protein
MAMGHRENVNLPQVKTALEMESHEEKLHNMIRQVCTDAYLHNHDMDFNLNAEPLIAAPLIAEQD